MRPERRLRSADCHGGFPRVAGSVGYISVAVAVGYGICLGVIGVKCHYECHCNLKSEAHKRFRCATMPRRSLVVDRNHGLPLARGCILFINE
jgi:hypothetical protein